MDDRFNIYVDRLKNGEDKIINETISPDFMDINEGELHFQKPISIKGKAYLTNESVVLNLAVDATAVMPCAICNSDVDVTIHIKDFSDIVELLQIRGGIFNFKDRVREEILLALPLVAECEGYCKEREFIAKYMKK